MPQHRRPIGIRAKAALERAVLASRIVAIPGSQMSTEWRATQNKIANHYVIEIAI